MPRSALRGIPAYAGGVVATAVNADGKREVLGIDVGTGEDGAVWLSFLRGLVARGLSGVELVTSDAHQGLRRRSRPSSAAPRGSPAGYPRVRGWAAAHTS